MLHFPQADFTASCHGTKTHKLALGSRLGGTGRGCLSSCTWPTLHPDLISSLLMPCISVYMCRHPAWAVCPWVSASASLNSSYIVSKYAHMLVVAPSCSHWRQKQLHSMAIPSYTLRGKAKRKKVYARALYTGCQVEFGGLKTKAHYSTMGLGMQDIYLQKHL